MKFLAGILYTYMEDLTGLSKINSKYAAEPYPLVAGANIWTNRHPSLAWFSMMY